MRIVKTKDLIQYVAAAFLSLSAAVMAKAPNIVNYQGRIQSGGADFTGTGQFKFAIVQNGTVLFRGTSPDLCGKAGSRADLSRLI